MNPEPESSHEYKTIVLIGGELHNIQVVVEKDEKEFEAVVSKPASWETKLYKQVNLNSLEFLLQQ
ncbi:MAG: hypothetical protein JWQ09_3766 [Segetibacter sp.]|nr:hypothetical protein [Segetibacter sp.]